MKKQYSTPATQEQSVLMNAQVLQTASPAGQVYMPIGSEIGGTSGQPIEIK